jgi:hypothetical protein
MRNFSYAFLVVLLFWISLPWYTMGQPPNPYCIQDLQNDSLPNFRNFYHFIPDGNKFQNIYYEGRAERCDFQTRSATSTWEHIILNTVIPIYQPKSKSPIAYQMIYTGQDYLSLPVNWEEIKIGTWLFWWSVPKWNPYIASLYAGIYTKLYNWPRGGTIPNNLTKWSWEAYFRSLEEPFRSAPMLQMYIYLGKPLLVARDSTWLVTHVYFQGRDIWDPIATAKKYLKDKWYAP